ncbi:transglutaminase-like domain-containing protein [Luteolibacter soli]|uniref:Transglutaminase family protein n=1 Tax=Luteolibacter soli TaxID=3135280 RepID=A0ABU9AS40_9BACT
MTPPRFLLGAALLFWGVMTDRVVPGLACAMLVEGAQWTRVRWNFGERAFLNAWRLSVLLLVVVMMLVLLNGARLATMSIVFTWLPVVLLPLEFVQAYGMSPTTTLATFSMMVRRRRDHARKHGLPFREVRFGFGHVYLCATLLASCLGSQADVPAFYPLLVLLGAWGLLSVSGRAWTQVGVAFFLSILASSFMGVGGEIGLMKLYRYLTTLGSSDGGYSSEYARDRMTSIGSLGRLKMSQEIIWRLIPEQGPLPKLLRVSSYNTYLAQSWQADLLPAKIDPKSADSKSADTKGADTKGADPKEEVPKGEVWKADLPPKPGDPKNEKNDGFDDVSEITNPDNPDDLEDKFLIAVPGLPDPKVAVDHSLPRFRLRGATPSTRNYTLLPLPGNVASLHQFNPQEFQRNPFGTFRLKPSQPVADARVLWDPGLAPELPPWKASASSYDRRRFDFSPVSPDSKKRVTVEPELQIPPSEAAAITKVATALHLKEVPFDEKIARLRRHFLTFQYTKYNKTAADFDPDTDGTLMAKFLTSSHAGHCEFFATATALLLREGGVPTRYVSGFVVAEIEPKTGQALLRGTHAHAWCRAWNAQSKHWIDVDLTPPDWLGMETPRVERFQGLSDWFQRVREDLLVWRDQPGHMMWITLGLLAPLALGMAYIGRNLWRSRSRLDAEKARLRGAKVAATPLVALERPARKLLGERPPGTPLAPWLMRLSSRLPQPEMLVEALALHHRLRFDPEAPVTELTAELRSVVEELRRDLGARS